MGEQLIVPMYWHSVLSCAGWGMSTAPLPCPALIPNWCGQSTEHKVWAVPGWVPQSWALQAGWMPLPSVALRCPWLQHLLQCRVCFPCEMVISHPCVCERLRHGPQLRWSVGIFCYFFKSRQGFCLGAANGAEFLRIQCCWQQFVLDWGGKKTCKHTQMRIPTQCCAPICLAADLMALHYVIWAI